LSLRLDGLSMMFGLLITGIGLLVILYARYYLAEKDSLGKLYGLLQIFMMAMLGIVTSDNILLMIVFWELTSLSSFLLISYWSIKAAAREGGRRPLMVTGGGRLSVLAGTVRIGDVTGTGSPRVTLDAGAIIREHRLYRAGVC